MKEIVVVGDSGAVGTAVVDGVLSLGHRVRRISRRAGISLDDRAALRMAFRGADAAFLMVPFDRAAADLHAREHEIVGALGDALAEAEVTRVVGLSGTSAHLGQRAGSGYGAAMLEERLDSLGIPELVHLRGCFFMENHLAGIPLIVQEGIYAWAFRGDRPTPMVAAADIGRVAAELLAAARVVEPGVREVLGAADYSMAKSAEILGVAIDKPDLQYVQLSCDDARGAMLQSGVSASFADAVMQTARGFNDWERWEREPRSATNSTPTTLEDFGQRVFRPAFEAAVAA
jgi:uncharacterized protein YbjT (DUF2867 family)